LVAIAALASVGLTACAAEDSGSDDNVVKVGLLSAYTGPLAIYGPAWEAGFRAGLEDLTDGTYEVDGVKIEIEVKDGAGDPATGLTMAKELIGEGTDVILGTASSSVAISVAQTAVENDVLFIAGAASTPQLNAMGPGIFRTSLDVRTINNSVLELVKQDGGKRIAYVGQDYAYGQDQAKALAAQAEDAGLTVEKFLLPVSTHDFTSGVAKIMSSGVDTLYVGWTGEGLAQLFQALVSQGAFKPDSPVRVVSLAPAPEEFKTVASAVGDESLKTFQLVNVYAENATGTAAEKVLDAYTAKAKDPVAIGPQQAYGYLGAQMLVKAIKDGGADLKPDVVNEALAGATFESVQGTVSIRAEDHLVEAPMFEYRLVKDADGYHLEQVSEMPFTSIEPPVEKSIS